MIVKDGHIPSEILNSCILAAEKSEAYKSLHAAGDGTLGFKFSWQMYDRYRGKDEMPVEFKQLWDSCKNLFPSGSSLYRCYINAQSFGIEDNIHEDDQELEKGSTGIVYLCSVWYPEWFGQTVFWEHLDRTEPNDIVHSVMPKHNRVVVFDKTIPHCVAPLSKRFCGVRYTCMFKVEHP